MPCSFPVAPRDSLLPGFVVASVPAPVPQFTLSRIARTVKSKRYRYQIQFACFECRKSFKRPYTVGEQERYSVVESAYFWTAACKAFRPASLPLP